MVQRPAFRIGETDPHKASLGASSAGDAIKRRAQRQHIGERLIKAKRELAFGRLPSYCKYELFAERYRSAAEIIRANLPLRRETRFLDVGPGMGYMKRFFDAHEGEWHAVECLKKRARVCEDLGYEVVHGDVNKCPLPYPDGFFDIAIASHVIEHVVKPDSLIAEMDRVLKSGGIALVATPIKPPGIASLVHFLYRWKAEKRLGETQHSFSLFSLKRLVESTFRNYELLDCRGFRLISMRKRSGLENIYTFYRINTFLGRHLASMTPEVNLIYRKN